MPGSSPSSSEARPSLRVVPKRAKDWIYGDPAVALASGYGLTPDPWQADAVKCLLVRRKNGRYAAATAKISVPRQNGKNAILEVRELFGMVVLGEAFLHTAHEVKTARKAFKRILSFFENERQFPEMARLVKEIRKTNGQEAIILTNGGSIEFIARSSGSGRGFTVDVLVCDEDQDLTDDELAALLPTISAAPKGNPQVILTGTPPDPDAPEAAKGEVARRVRRDAIEGTDPDLYCLDFGVPDGPLPDVSDERLVYQTNPSCGSRLAVEETRRERKLMSPEKFARERLGWWGNPKAQVGGIFGQGRWTDCRVQATAPPPVAAIGIGVSFDEEWSSIAAVGWWPDGRPNLGAVRRDAGTAWLVEEAARIQGEYGVPVVLDEKCPDAKLAERLRARDVEVTVTTLEQNAEACSELRNRVKARQLTHLGTGELDDAEAGAAWRVVGDGRKVIGRRQSRGDVSMLEAAAMALHGAMNEADYDVEDSLL